MGKACVRQKRTEGSAIGIPMGESLLKKFLNLMKFFTYILLSQTHKTYYYGHCADLTKRLDDHNNGRVRYTKGRRPWKIHYFETFDTRSEAVRRERFFKTIEGYNFLKNNNII